MKKTVLFFFYLLILTSGIAQTYFENDDIKVHLKSELKTALYSHYIGAIGNEHFSITIGSTPKVRRTVLFKHNSEGKKIAKVNVATNVHGAYKRMERHSSFTYEGHNDVYKIINNELFHFIPDFDIESRTRRLWVEKINLVSLAPSKPQLLFEHKNIHQKLSHLLLKGFTIDFIPSQDNPNLNVLIVNSNFGSLLTTCIYNDIDVEFDATAKTKVIAIENGNFTAVNKQINTDNTNYIFLGVKSALLENGELSIPISKNESIEDSSQVVLYKYNFKLDQGSETNMFKSKYLTFTSSNSSLPFRRINDKIIWSHLYIRSKSMKSYYKTVVFDLKTNQNKFYNHDLDSMSMKNFINDGDREYFYSLGNSLKKDYSDEPFTFKSIKYVRDENNKEYLIGSIEPSKTYYNIGHTSNGQNSNYNVNGDIYVFSIDQEYKLELVSMHDINNLPQYTNPGYFRFINNPSNFYGYHQNIVKHKDNHIYLFSTVYTGSKDNNIGDLCFEIVDFDLKNNEINLLKRIEKKELKFRHVNDVKNPFEEVSTFVLTKEPYLKLLEIELK